MSSSKTATARSSLGSQGVCLRPGTPRIERLRRLLLREPLSICLERPELLRAFEHSAEGRAVCARHATERRAWALRYLLTNRAPRVYAEELIVGNMSSQRIAANYYPEGASINIVEDIARLETRTVPLHLTLEQKRRLLRLAVWGVRRCIGVRALVRPGRLAHFLRLFKPVRYLVTEEAGVSHFAGGYGVVLQRGLRDVDERARRCLASGLCEDGTPAGEAALAFYHSIRIAIEGLRAMAKHLAEECERQARLPNVEEGRRGELRRAADACRHVPYEPARSFFEGLQACWLMHIAFNMEDYEQGLSFGRLDQILWPLYQNDVRKGLLDEDRALEIIASFQLKTCETVPLFSENVDLGFNGNTVGQAITLGGVDGQGCDATNTLSGLFLEAFSQVRTREPNIQVRVHADTPDWFLRLVCEVLQLGCGQPALFGDQVVVRALQEAGVSEAHARDYAVVGCVEPASPGRTYNSSDAAQFNLALCLELALNEGYRLQGSVLGRRTGGATPAVHEMHDIEAVWLAFRAQVEDAVGEMAQVMGWLEECYREHRTTPFASMAIEGCMERGRDVTWGGARYDMTSIQAVGLADVGDSFAAIQRLVFEERRYSLEEFVQILRRNFADALPLQTRLRTRYDHYGCGVEFADAMTRRAADVFVDVITARRNTRGGKWLPGFYTMTCHTSFARCTGAMPNGRSAGARLSNGYSPADGADVAGPTALLRSAASLNQHRWSNGGALNIKFDASTLSGAAGDQALVDLILYYLVDEGGMQLQINIMDADTLRAAQRNPEAYPNLLVRVSGYCAYFRDLQPQVQDEIIERTSHGVG